MYLYKQWKIVSNILIGFKIWREVGGGGAPFSKIPYEPAFSNIRYRKSYFFFMFIFALIVFENLKCGFYNAKLEKLVSKLMTFLFGFCWM